jgi:CheY-like chemotaxis protein
MIPGHGGPLRILLVEDNPDHAELIRRGFAENSDRVELTVMPDGEAAVGYLFRRGSWAPPHSSPRPHLILLDLRLPKLDGFQVLQEVKDSPELCQIPTVILTTSEAEGDMARAYAQHANSYLVKPVDFERFVSLVADIEGYWLEWNRQPAATA